MNALTGKPVDRTPVNFYEIGGLPANPDDPDPYTIYNDPSWRPLLDLAERDTDIIRMIGPHLRPSPQNCRSAFFTERTEEVGNSRFTWIEIQTSGRRLTETRRRDQGVNTVWVTEHLLKTPEDVRAFLDIPDEAFSWVPDVTPLLQAEDALGDRGIVMADTGDPLCAAAALFSMEDYLSMAYIEPQLFHQLLEKVARSLYPWVEEAAAAFPGRLWRIYGPEYATEPYLPPSLFREYVYGYTLPLVRAIQRHGGMVRLHSHGRISSVLPIMEEMGVDAIDPIEPPPQGDTTLAQLRARYGLSFTLFGNIEVSAIETLPPDLFEGIVADALCEGNRGQGKGFVLMPTASPYGRHISATTMRNYETMIRLSASM